MPFPAALPAEIIDAIVGYLNPDELSLPYFFRPQRERFRVANLYACSLVSRAWYHRSTPQLYSRFQYVGDRDSFSILVHFLRTIVEKPELGALVQHLDLREWQPDMVLDSEIPVAREERSRCYEARSLYDIGSRIGFTREEMSDALLSEKRQPFDILLICCLPNLSTFHFSPDTFGEASYDCLGHALEQPGMLNKLQNATFFSSPRGVEWWFKNVDAVLSLPSLRKLVLIDIAIGAMAEHAHHKNIRASSITDLTIVPGDETGLRSREAQEWLSDCLLTLKPLVSLTLHIPDHTGRSLFFEFPNHQLWKLLWAHRHSLQYLDIYSDDPEEIPYMALHFAPSNLLREFKRLHTLRIQPLVLSGGIGGITGGPIRLQDTFPPSLRSLTLYYSIYPALRFVTELLDFVSDPSFLNLDYLILQDPLDMLEYDRPGRFIAEIRQSLHDLFRDGNILFKLMPLDLLPKGGRNLMRSPEAADPERYVYESYLAEKSSLAKVSIETPVGL